MKVKITKCNDRMMWYSSHVGEIYDVHRDCSKDTGEYIVRASDGYLNIIRFQDCIVVNDCDSVPNVLANLAVSGIKPSEFCTDLLYKVANKELTYEEAVKRVKEHYETTNL